MNNSNEKTTKNYRDQIIEKIGDISNLPFQLDFINKELTKHNDIINNLNTKSTRLQHLLDEKPRLMRFWFKDFDTAFSLLIDVKKNANISVRLICLEKNALFFQLGHFE